MPYIALIVPLLLAALLVQAWTGGVTPAVMAFPVNVAVAAAALVVLWVAESEWGSTAWLKRLRSGGMACTLLVLTVLWCVAGGLVTQQHGAPLQPAWWHAFGLHAFTTSWPFVVLLALLQLHLALLLMHRLRHEGLPGQWTFVALHGGLLLALAAGFLGSADLTDHRTIVTRHEATRTAYDADGLAHPLPWALQLTDFTVQRNAADGSPSQFVASLTVDDAPVTLAVNEPKALTWCDDLYLTSYDRAATDGHTAYCIVQVVHNPWKWLSYAGLALLMAGSTMLLRRVR